MLLAYHAEPPEHRSGRSEDPRDDRPAANQAAAQRLASTALPAGPGSGHLLAVPCRALPNAFELVTVLEICWESWQVDGSPPRRGLGLAKMELPFNFNQLAPDDHLAMQQVEIDPAQAEYRGRVRDWSATWVGCLVSMTPQVSSSVCPRSERAAIPAMT